MCQHRNSVSWCRGIWFRFSWLAISWLIFSEPVSQLIWPCLDFPSNKMQVAAFWNDQWITLPAALTVSFYCCQLMQLPAASVASCFKWFTYPNISCSSAGYLPLLPTATAISCYRFQLLRLSAVCLWHVRNGASGLEPSSHYSGTTEGQPVTSHNYLKI